MRVLVMMSGIALGGGERSVIAMLPHLVAEGVEPTLCTLNVRRDSSLVADFGRTGIERVDLGARRMLDPKAWLGFRALLQRERFDVVNTQDQDTHVYGALARRLVGVPVVMTRHVMAEPAGSWKGAVRARLVLVAARLGADRVIAVSDAVRDRFWKQAHLDPERIVTVHNGVDVERFAPRGSREEARRTLGWSPERSVVTMIGVLRPGKGHDVLLRAVVGLRETAPAVAVKIVGSGELEESLRAEAASLGGVVEFLGERSDVPTILSASDALVLPSWTEGFPTVLLEAGAVGIPVVATTVGGTGEIVEDGRTGYLVRPGDVDGLVEGLVRLLRDPAAAQAMGNRARERVTARFSLTSQARRTIAVYEDAIRSR